MFDNEVQSLFEKTKENYPYIKRIKNQYFKSSLLEFSCILVNAKTLKYLCGVKSDFLGKYTKECIIIVPIDYKTNGCKVYCKKWKEILNIPNNRMHYEQEEICGFTKLCVGVKGSFSCLLNPILESLKTAEHILNAYELYIKGCSNDIILIDYKHGEEGLKEYESNSKKYKNRK